METSITWCSEDKEWRVWTDNPSHAARIERSFSIEPYRTDTIDGETTGRFYVLPAGKYRPFSAKRNVTMSDEQRSALRTRFQRQAGMGGNGAISGDSVEIGEIYLDEDLDDSSEEFA